MSSELEYVFRESVPAFSIETVCATILEGFGIAPEPGMAPAHPELTKLREKKLGTQKFDRAVIYNPDAIGWWLYRKYPEKFQRAADASDVVLPMYSEMPSVTPVCFASMYTGVSPKIHGIRSYIKPVLRQTTLFDVLLKAGLKPAIVSTAGDSISMIFLERDMDYFIYDTPEEINHKSLELLNEDKYDVLVIYNGNYDHWMHQYGPEGERAMAALDQNVTVYCTIVDTLKRSQAGRRTFFGFCPDHGCHEIDGGLGSHGLDMDCDMYVVHMYGIL